MAATAVGVTGVNAAPRAGSASRDETDTVIARGLLKTAIRASMKTSTIRSVSVLDVKVWSAIVLC